MAVFAPQLCPPPKRLQPPAPGSRVGSSVGLRWAGRECPHSEAAAYMYFVPKGQPAESVHFLKQIVIFLPISFNQISGLTFGCICLFLHHCHVVVTIAACLSLAIK